MRALAIVNPAAGKRKAPLVWQRVAAEIDGLREWECVMTERAGHARELAASASASGYERVVAVGGDGTICEVANALAHTDTTLAMIPVGTGNDCSASLGVPSDPLGAARLALSGTPRAIDLGFVKTVQTRMYFVNVAGFGFDAEVAWRVNRMPRLTGGTLPYIGGVLQTLLRYRSPRMRIRADSRLIERRVFLVAVANQPSYGGGMRIAPDARSDDGELDVCIVSDLSRLEVLRLVPRMYSGGHVGHPAVELCRVRELTVEAERGVRCQADGELVGDLPASFGVEPGALRCVTAPVDRPSF